MVITCTCLKNNKFRGKVQNVKLYHIYVKYTFKTVTKSWKLLHAMFGKNLQCKK